MNLTSIEQIGEVLRGERVEGGILKALWDRRQPVDRHVAKKDASEDEPKFDWLRHDPELIRQFAAHALAAEEFLMVCDAAQEGLRLEAGASGAEARRTFVLLRCDYAAAFARLGSFKRAQSELEIALRAECADTLDAGAHAEVLTLLANIRSDAARAEPTAPEMDTGFVAALDACQRALALHPGSLEARTHSAILRLHLRQEATAHTGAEDVLRLTDSGGGAGESEFRALAARAAALAVLGRIEEARDAYRKLRDVPKVTMPELADARHRARFLARALRLQESAFDDRFPPLRLLVFSGHLPDAAGRSVPRFPNTPQAIEVARAAIAERLDQMEARVGFSAAAAGADLIFLEELLKRGGTAHVVLPWSREQFIAESVRPFGDEWVARFESVIGRVAGVRELGETYRLDEPIALEYQMEVTAGLAKSIARASRLDLQPLVLWDGGAGLSGGTGAFVAFWENEMKVRSERVWPFAAADVPAVVSATASDFRTHRVEEPIVRQHVKTMLFADIVGYSKMREQLIPRFVSEFLGRVAEVVASSPFAPMSVNTWGDALYFVFDRAADGGRFALDLLRMIADRTEEWRRMGLGWNDGAKLHTPNVRIGLHAGPVYMHFDPVVRRLSFTGAHVSRAARIEPITEVGGVFASEEFAAMAAVNRAEGFACEFVGTMPLAKGFPGLHRIYRLVPVRTLPLDRLARMTHRNYVNTMRERGESAATLPAMRDWEELPDDLQAANLAQAADVENKLRALGYELVETFGMRPSEIEIAPARLEEMARTEHTRWMEERLSQGWTYGPERNNTLKLHPLLVPWEQLSEPEREKDRDAIRNVPLLVAEAGFRVRRIGGMNG